MEFELEKRETLEPGEFTVVLGGLKGIASAEGFGSAASESHKGLATENGFGSVACEGHGSNTSIEEAKESPINTVTFGSAIEASRSEIHPSSTVRI